MRILFVTSNRIGDAVLSTGLLDHLLRVYPQARFTVACGPVAEGVFLRMPRLDRLILMEKRPHARHWLPLWAAAVRTVWDLVVDLRASALAWLVPARRRAVLRPRSELRMLHKTAQIATVLRLDHAPLPVCWTSPEDRALAARLLPAGAPVVALGPTANWTGKIWPAERFAMLFRGLASGTLASGRLAGARAAVFAGPGDYERRLAAPVLAALPDAIDLAGRLSLPEAAACLSRAALYVGNDSGLMHMAAAAGTPTLGLFGPTPAHEYGPAGPRGAACVSSSERMEDLTLDQALRAAETLIAVRAAA